MDRITYLLGAGASFNALPLTLEIPFHLEIMENYINKNLREFPVDTLIGDIRDLRNQLNEYNTIDGYARMLSQNRVNSENKLKLSKLKSILCCLFMFEQLKKKELIWSFAIEPGDNRYDQTNYSRAARTIDPRYKSFFAKILNGPRLDERINIISWNYDIQLEIGIENNLGFKYDNLNDSCTIYPHPTTRHKTGDLLNDLAIHDCLPQIVKLNGTAGIFFNKNSFHNIYLDQNEFFEDRFETLLEIHKETIRYSKYNPYLRFAWEQDDLTKRALEYAQTIFRNTDVLVVIGYSFPDFNRTIDYQIFRDNRIKEIFVQLPDTDIDTVKYSMETSLDRSQIDKVKHIKNLNEFFIPRQFIPNYQP
ncbi:MAG: hypothetical protein J7502_02160 [Flavisolibacter sp.]|nr:hypothetical protein [Flavisolibacter sp.]